MKDHTPPRLKLPSAALQTPTHLEPHVDSEEAVQYERCRVSRELELLHHLESSRQSSEAAPTTALSNASLRSRNASLLESTLSRENLRRHSSSPIAANTQLDASENRRQSTASTTRTRHWHDAITKFWNRHISITIDEGAHRDHLGTLVLPHAFSELLLITVSTRAHLPRLPPHFPPSCHDWRFDSPDISPPTCREPKYASWILCHRTPA
jgi:hypothetical protein